MEQTVRYVLWTSPTLLPVLVVYDMWQDVVYLLTNLHTHTFKLINYPVFYSLQITMHPECLFATFYSLPRSNGLHQIVL
jgi:hypothetical protein